jgi:hypothetical protein
MKTAALFLSLLLIGVPSHADDLPAKPERVIDSKFMVASALVVGSWAADIKSTNDSLRYCSACFERGWFGRGGHDMGKIAVGTALFDAGIGFASYEMKKHLHGRVLRYAWIAPMAWRVEAHSGAAAYNEIHVYHPPPTVGPN